MICIDDSNAHIHQASGFGHAKGLISRNFNTHPQGYLGRVAEPYNIPNISESEIPARIALQEKDKSSLQHIREKGNNGLLIPSRDQNGKGYCWAHSTVGGSILINAIMNKPYVDLSAYAIACMIKNFRDEGGNNSDSLKFMTEKGCPDSTVWPQQSMSRSNDNPNTWANALGNKVTQWWDLSNNPQTVKLQMATLLLNNIPVMIDLDWWGHSVCAVRLMSWSPFVVRIWNSWGDSWSDKGMGDLKDSKAIPNGAAAPRVLMAA